MRHRLTILTFLCVAFFVDEHTSFAQDLHNGSTIHVNGINLFVDGEINNAGLVVNAGAISLTGDWKNKGDYEGNGRVELSGHSPQVISHNDQAINTLVINGWGTKYVDGNLNVSHGLHLVSGVVDVSRGNALVLGSEAVVSGGSAGSYVDGALTVEGTGYKFFPIGKNGTYAPIELVNVQGPIRRYSMEVFENAPAVSVENVIVRNALYSRRKDIIGEFGSSPVAIDYERNYFEDPDNIILLAGDNFDDQLITIDDLDHSTETNKISTRMPLSASIIMLGEISSEWTDADFYLSTALSPHAVHAENRTVKIFGDRLRDDGFNFRVFDRWGDVVFETPSLERMQNHGWDGRTAAGTALASGTYPYRLVASDKMGKKFERKGIVTIIH